MDEDGQFAANIWLVEAAKRGREVRRQTNLPANAILPDGSIVSMTVVDLSHDGCKVETPVPLALGSCLPLSLSKIGLLEAHVHWYSAGKAGLRFTPEPDKAEDERPRADRVSLQAAVTLRRRGSANYNVSTSDVSPSGCKVQFVERPRVGETHWLKFDGLEALEAEVRWVEDFNAGVQFARAIHPAVFDMLLARLS